MELDIDYMQLAFADDLSGYDLEDAANIQADLRRAVSYWIFLVDQNNKLDKQSKPQRLDKQFQKKVEGWGYCDKLKSLPLDSITINLRDIINSYLIKHPVRMIADMEEPGTLGLQYEPSDNVSGIWNDLLWNIYDYQSHKLCAQCGKPFLYVSHRASYCGDACRTRASRERNASA